MTLKAKDATIIKLYHRENPQKYHVDKPLCYHIQSSYGRYKKKMNEKAEAQKLKGLPIPSSSTVSTQSSKRKPKQLSAHMAASIVRNNIHAQKIVKMKRTERGTDIVQNTSGPTTSKRKKQTESVQNSKLKPEGTKHTESVKGQKTMTIPGKVSRGGVVNI